MILDIPPQTAQMIIATAEQQGLTVDELLLNAIGHYSHDVMLNSDTPLAVDVSDDGMTHLLALLDDDTPPNAELQALMQKFGGLSV